MASMNTAKDKAQDATDKAKDAAREAADSAREKAGSTADYVQDKAGDAAEYVQDKASSAYHAVSDYVSDMDLKGMGQDLTSLIRKYPLASVAVGIGVGMLLAGLTRR